MIFLSEIRGQCYRRQPAKGCYIKDERTQIKKWCKLVRVLKQKCVKTNGCKTKAGCIYSKKHVFNMVHAINVPQIPQFKILAPVRLSVAKILKCDTWLWGTVYFILSLLKWSQKCLQKLCIFSNQTVYVIISFRNFQLNTGAYLSSHCVQVSEKNSEVRHPRRVWKD